MQRNSVARAALLGSAAVLALGLAGPAFAQDAQQGEAEMAQADAAPMTEEGQPADAADQGDEIAVTGTLIRNRTLSRRRRST